MLSISHHVVGACGLVQEVGGRAWRGRRQIAIAVGTVAGVMTVIGTGVVVLTLVTPVAGSGYLLARLVTTSWSACRGNRVADNAC